MTPVPVRLIAGGRESLRRGGSEPLREAIASLGITRPTLAYVGCAAEDSAPFRLFMSGILRRAGSGKISNVALCGKRPDLSAAKGRLDAADAVFISGGDVEAGMSVLGRLGLAPYLRALAEQGKPFLGLSAGAIMLSSAWVRWRETEGEESPELFPCLGLAPVYCDVHDEDSGWSELRALLHLLPQGTEAWGIPAGGDLIVGADAGVAWTGPAPAHFRRTARGVISS